jgi:hypothetical protein
MTLINDSGVDFDRHFSDKVVDGHVSVSRS